jgi:ketosteroid isomerase-like protein
MIELAETGMPDVVDEIRACFYAYEDALLLGDTEVLNRCFWLDAATVRFGVSDRQHGHSEIALWRKMQLPAAGRQLAETHIVAFDRDLAVVTTLFSYPGRGMEGRQSQTWVRFADGWRIVAAHVSEVAVDNG